jgi:diguanylate cyclase (GGDEF)-like protein
MSRALGRLRYRLRYDLPDGQRLWRGWVIGDFLQLALVVAPLLRFAGARASTWVDQQFRVPPQGETSIARRTMFSLVIVGTMAVVVLVGIGMLQSSLDIDPLTRTRSGELLVPRLFEIQFFLLLLVVVVFVSTGIFSRALGRSAERRVLARRDSLTGCFNRRTYYELFQREADRSRRLRQGVSLIFLDVDHFKHINDRFGHDTGDRLLQQLAMRLQGVVRKTHLLMRWGGEEFVILLPHTSHEDAPVLAERVRRAVVERPFVGLESHVPLPLSVSLGTSGTLDYPADPDILIAAADAACYRANESERNRVVRGHLSPATA